jgi:hypothetical protein
MKIVTKNYSLQNGKRSYLVYLKDDNDKSIECFDLEGNDKRLEKENELSEKYTIDTENITYFSLEEFKSQEHNKETPLFLIFYLNEDMFNQREMVKSYGENVKRYLEDKGDNIRLFFMPTKDKERIECINPIYIDDEMEFEKLDMLIKEIEKKFQVGVM